ncbi:hypothetical protein D5086_021613 [Populus alba]|uniref:Uncharacterized protein n=1 Tax=Populus alba TaxID=43335 RepID=A0ACC4BCU7_POPAL
MSSSQAFTPPRTKVVFANFTGPSCGVRVYSKHRNTAMQKNSPSTKSPPLLLLVVAIKVPLVAPDLASHRLLEWVSLLLVLLASLPLLALPLSHPWRRIRLHLEVIGVLPQTLQQVLPTLTVPSSCPLP